MGTGRATVPLWRAEGNLEDSVLSFYHVGTGYQTQIVSLGGRRLPLLSHLPGTLHLFLRMDSGRLVILCQRLLKSLMACLQAHARSVLPIAVKQREKDTETLTVTVRARGESICTYVGLPAISYDKMPLESKRTVATLSGAQRRNQMALQTRKIVCAMVFLPKWRFAA